MKFKGLGFALAACLTMLGCGGGGGSSTNINLRTVVLVHTAAYGVDTITVSGSQTGTISQATAPSFQGFNLVTSTPQNFAATDTSASPNIPLGSYNQTTTTANAFYTLYVTGVEENTGQYAPAVGLIQENPPTAVTGQSMIRFVNFSVSAGGAVDVYVTSSATSSLTGATKTFSAVGYGSPTNYVTLPGATYYVRVTQAGNSSNVLYTSPATTFVNGLDYTNYGWDASATSFQLYTSQDVY